MPLINDPDYSKYTLEELYDVVQHIDRVRYADRYYRVLEEFEKRSGQPMPPKPPRHTPRQWLTQALWKHGDSQRDFRAIIAWWEERRRFYNLFVFAIAGASVSTSFALAFVKDFREGRGVASLTLVDIAMISLATALSFAVVSAVLYVCVNIFYLFFWLIDGALSIPLRIFGWRLSVALFALVLSSTLLILAIPVVRASLSLLSN